MTIEYLKQARTPQTDTAEARRVAQAQRDSMHARSADERLAKYFPRERFDT